jgi:hypothetical protein
MKSMYRINENNPVHRLTTIDDPEFLNETDVEK